VANTDAIQKLVETVARLSQSCNLDGVGEPEAQARTPGMEVPNPRSRTRMAGTSGGIGMAGHWLPGLELGLIALQGVEEPAPAGLVAKLGSSRYSEREAAGETLARIGRPAMPALLKARESGDPEVRPRAEALAARIEAGEVLDATRIKLDVRDLPLPEAVDAIAKASGMRLRPGAVAGNPRAEPTWPDRRVTVESAEPIPFWEVIDRFCRAGGLRREYPPAGENFFPFKSPFDLTLVEGQAEPPASDTGALRVELLRIRYSRERNYGDQTSEFANFGGRAVGRRSTQAGVTESSSYAAELLISAEPRVRIFAVGEVEKPEAIDDRGRSLLRVPTAEEEKQQLAFWQMNPHLDPRLNPPPRYGSGSHRSMRTWPVSIDLSYPSPRAHRLERLRGVIPVVVVARRPDPLVVELKDASGKAFSAGSTRITIHSIKAESGREPTIDLTLEEPRPGGVEEMMVCDSKGNRLAIAPPHDLMELRLEVLDESGESLFWQYTQAPTERNQGRMSIVVHDRNSKRPRPDDLRLRFWGAIGAATDLPFAFKDVPTP
jgi:hypothetical protein